MIVPYLRGYGTTRFLSSDTLRNGQQAALAVDAIALMDALGIERAIVAGFDWGARSANIVAALWPERCKAMVSVSGYLIGSQAAGKAAACRPRPSCQWWYQYYFATERGRAGLRQVPARVRQADLAHRLAAVELRRRDVRSQRGGVRQPGSRGDRRSTTTAGGSAWPTARRGTTSWRRDSPGARHRRPHDHARGRRERRAAPGAERLRQRFSGKYEHRTIAGGIGHNLPQEAPEAFAQAVIDVDAF